MRALPSIVVALLTASCGGASSFDVFGQPPPVQGSGGGGAVIESTVGAGGSSAGTAIGTAGAGGGREASIDPTPEPRPEAGMAGASPMPEGGSAGASPQESGAGGSDAGAVDAWVASDAPECLPSSHRCDGMQWQACVAGHWFDESVCAGHCGAMAPNNCGGFVDCGACGGHMTCTTTPSYLGTCVYWADVCTPPDTGATWTCVVVVQGGVSKMQKCAGSVDSPSAHPECMWGATSLCPGGTGYICKP